MFKLICYLTAIYQYSKTIHYEVKGEAFYGSTCLMTESPKI